MNLLRPPAVGCLFAATFAFAAPDPAVLGFGPATTTRVGKQ
jgi:hypothetical protein